MPDGSQQKVGEVKLNKPMEVLFEGGDLDIYKPLTKDEIDTEFFDWLNNKVPENFAFLLVGLWGKGAYGEDRKDIGTTIKVFYETFANKKKQPALILKTSGATFSILSKEEILKKINTVKSQFPSDWKLPNVYLLHGDLSSEEMNYLYNHPKVKAMVSLTHGEGFGRPLLEASMVGLPIIASGWSGQMDFLSQEYSILLNGKLEKVPSSQVWKDIIVEESKWFNADESEASRGFKYLYENEKEMKSKSKKLMDINRDKFNLSKMEDRLGKIVESYTKNMPSQVGLNLPKLKKVDNSKSDQSSIKLPKLKKVTETV